MTDTTTESFSHFPSLLWILKTSSRAIQRINRDYAHRVFPGRDAQSGTHNKCDKSQPDISTTTILIFFDCELIAVDRT